jgi:hypothetical protein
MGFMTALLTELVTKPYCPNRDWHVCTTVNLYGFKTSSVAACTGYFESPISGVSVFKIFVDMILNTVQYHLMFV